MSELSRISILFLLTLLLSPSLFAQAPSAVAILDQVKCDARWHSVANPQESPIDQLHDRALPLSPGDQLRCTTPGHLTLIINDQLTTVKYDDGPYTIPAPQNVAPKRQLIQQLISSAISFQGAAASTSKQSQRILFPIDNEALLPSDFLIRWKPLSNGEKISFALFLQNSPSPLWSSPELDGNAGVFQATEARKSLEAIRRQQSPSNSVQIQLQPSVHNQPEDRVNFALLSADEEASLNSEIKQWDLMDSQLLQYLGRGYSYSTRNLFFDAAREYDRAVTQLGDSCRLLLLAIDANSRIGRSDRVDLLNQKISRIPDSCPALAPQLH